jgi:hypothetical protein
MHYKDDCYPYRDKLTSYRNKLQPEPNFPDISFVDNKPGIVKRNERFPWFYACFFKHAIQANMPTNNIDEKYNPAHK